MKCDERLLRYNTLEDMPHCSSFSGTLRHCPGMDQERKPSNILVQKIHCQLPHISHVTKNQKLEQAGN